MIAVAVGINVPNQGLAGLIVNGLITAAEVERERDPVLAAVYQGLADEIGDGLDELPSPSAIGSVPDPGLETPPHLHIVRNAG